MYIYRDTSLRIKKSDITEERVDAIVNAANNSLLGGGGVDGAIHRAGGPEILEQCKKLGGCPTGEARITVAGNLPAKYVIHTVGPIYKKDKNQDNLLYNAYYNSLKLAADYGLKSIAFPSISTGAFAYPKEQALEIALRATRDFLDSSSVIEEISYVLFSDEDFNLYKSYLDSENQ